MKKHLLPLAIGFLFLVGCEKEAVDPNQIKYYTVSFDPSPGKFFLENNGNVIVANGVSLGVSVQVNYNEVSESGAKLGSYTTTLNETIKTDSAGKMILNIHPADTRQISQERFQLQTTQYKKDGTKVLIGQINSINVLIETKKNNVTYQKNYVVNSTAYFWDYVEGYFPLFGSDLPEFETRSSSTLSYYGSLLKYWYLKLVSNITLNKI